MLEQGYRKRYGQLLDSYSVEDEIHKLRSYKEQLGPYVVDAVEYMKSVKDSGRNLLVEASQALMVKGFLFLRYDLTLILLNSSIWTSAAFPSSPLLLAQLEDVFRVLD